MSRNDLPHCEFSSDEFEIHFEASIPADVGQIDPVVSRILNLVGQMGCGEGSEFEIETALREALANAILHGCGEDHSKQVGISVGCAETSGILIVVRDPGEGFVPEEIPSPLVGENLYSDHGRGIFLINQLMDEVEFQRRGTEIRMIKRSSES